MKWLTENIGTAPFNEINQDGLEPGVVVVDVRDLVDKAGNDLQVINIKIDESLQLLTSGNKIIICCDYGMSRSNSLAIGVIVKWLKISFEEAVAIAKRVVDESGIKIEMLNTVFAALYNKQPADNDERAGIRNICITGSTGFLGRNLFARLKDKFKISTPSSKDINLIENIVELDLLVKNKKIECIVHLANPKVFTNTKAIGETIVMLKNILDVCRTNNIKIIFLSGWEIYSGYKSDFLLADENLIPNPKGTYGETKWLCELLVKQYVKTYAIKHQIIRSGPVYGVNAEKPKFIYNFIDKARRGEIITTHKYLNGDPKLDLLYIDDLVAFLEKAITSEYVGELNIGSGKMTSTHEVARIICDKTNSDSKLERVNVADYSANIEMDFTLAKKMFQWSPQIDVETGLTRILETYKNE